MARPIPRPCALVVKNGVNALLTISFEKPGPVSLSVISMISVSAALT